MNEAQKAVLELMSAALFDEAIKVPSETDWQSVYDEIRRQSLVSLLYPLAADLDVPSDVKDRWSSERDRYLLNNAKNIGGHFRIQKLLDGSGIPCVILKGIASASYYPNYMLRAFGDVDFLVPKTDHRRASKLLEKNGYEYINRHDKHLIYSRGGIEYELHKDIVGVPDTSIRKVFDGYFSDIFDSAVEFTHHGSRCLIPSDRHHCVILLVHTAEHLAKTGVGLRHLCDWAVFADRMPDSFFEDEMQAILKDMGIWHFAGILTCLCTKYLGLRKCNWAEEVPDEHLAELIEDVFDSGEFGRIQEDAAAEDPTLGTRSSDLVSAGTLRAFAASINRGARTVIPAAADHPILLPAGWVFVTGRYLARMLRGKRSAAKARDNIVRLGRRQELTEEWRLFERQVDER